MKRVRAMRARIPLYQCILDSEGACGARYRIDACARAVSPIHASPHSRVANLSLTLAVQLLDLPRSFHAKKILQALLPFEGLAGPAALI